MRIRFLPVLASWLLVLSVLMSTPLAMSAQEAPLEGALKLLLQPDANPAAKPETSGQDEPLEQTAIDDLEFDSQSHQRSYSGPDEPTRPNSRNKSSGFSLRDDSTELPVKPIAQPDEISCGPTSAAMVLDYFDIAAGIGPLKTKSGTTWWEVNGNRFGMTHPSKLKSAIESYGLKVVEHRGTLDQIANLIDRRLPSILLVRSGEWYWHYIVVSGYRDLTRPGGFVREFKISDPGGAQEYWLSAEELEAAWQFSADLQGNKIEGRRCRVCGGEGRVGKGWTSCPTCFGKGKFLGNKCRACNGDGKLESPGAHCAVCDGDGRETDAFRKAIESSGVKGKTMLVAGRKAGNSSASGNSSGSGSTAGGSTGSSNAGNTGTEQIRKISVSFRNRTAATVQFHLSGGKGLDSSLAPGNTQNFSMVTSSRQPPVVTINQRDGSQLKFSLADNGKYDFTQDGPYIKNSFRPTSADASTNGGSGGATNSGSNGTGGMSGLDEQIIVPDVPDVSGNGATAGSSSALQRSLGATFTQQDGRVVVRSLFEGSPLANAFEARTGQTLFLEAGDEIAAVNGVRIRTLAELVAQLANRSGTLQLDVRDVNSGAIRKLEIVVDIPLAGMPGNSGNNQPGDLLQTELPGGAEPGGGAPQSRPKLGLRLSDQPEGVRIDAVVPDSPATRCTNNQTGQIVMLEAGDYVLAVNGIAIRRHTEVASLLETTGEFMLLKIRDQRTGQALEVTVDLRADR